MVLLAAGSNAAGALGVGHAHDVHVLTAVVIPAARRVWTGGRHSLFGETTPRARSG